MPYHSTLLDLAFHALSDPTRHPRPKVFAAWMDPAALSQWYGPDGLSIESHEAGVRDLVAGRMVSGLPVATIRNL
jgi:hypothetical protein